METLSTRDDFLADRGDRGTHDRAVALRTTTNIAFGASVALAALGTVLLFTSK
jgi:hypothetical protein